MSGLEVSRIQRNRAGPVYLIVPGIRAESTERRGTIPQLVVRLRAASRTKAQATPRKSAGREGVAEPDFKYFSKRIANVSVRNSRHMSKHQGFQGAVDGF